MSQTDLPSQTSALPEVLVITPVFNERDGLSAYREAVTRHLLESDEANFSILLVDDGSEDGSWEAIDAMCREDNRFQGIRLSRNFGSHVALSAGIDHAEADAVCTLACDLQDPPEVILDFLRKWRQGARIVWGHRRTREDSSWRIATSKVFFWLLRRFALPRNSKFTTGSFFLIDHTVVECFRRFREQGRITFAIVAWTGFSQDLVYYDRRERTVGQSKWKFGGMLKTMYDAFIGFSALPARLITSLGLVVSFAALTFAVYLILDWWLFGTQVPGWTGIMVALTSFFGLAFLILGLLSEYLHRIYSEVTQRPLYFVSDSVGSRIPPCSPLGSGCREPNRSVGGDDRHAATW